ncbi:MAG TPA: nucleoside triphosphate hydrolase, partial [Bacillales bacterium]|nr:nucleoside triphosphate hydrolase [Bacillales bacterium]
ILEGEYRQIAARVIALMKEIDLKNAELTKMDLYRLSAEKKETIKRLCKQRPLLDQAFEKYEKEQLEKETELEEKVNILTQNSDHPNIDELEAIIDSVKRAGHFEESLEALIFESNRKWQQINTETKQLALWDGTYQELIELPVPGLIETIHKYEQEHSAIMQSIHKINDHIHTQNDLIEMSKARIRELESFAEIPSEETLKNARENREFGWKLIRIKLKNGILDEKYISYTTGQEIETVYEESVRNSDHVSDKMRQEAAKVGEKNKLLADIAGYQNKIEGLEIEKVGYEAELEKWKSDWFELWKPSTIIPLTPAEMVGWLVRLNQIKDLGRTFEKDQLLIKELEMKKLRFKQLLIRELSRYESISEEKTVDELLRIAENYFKKFRDEQYKRSNLQCSILDVKGTLEKINSEKKDIESKIEIWKSEWIKAVEGTNISINTPAEVAESLLEIYEDCTRTYDHMLRIDKEKIAIQEQISLFEVRVRDILTLIQIDLDNENIHIAVNQMYDHLQRAQKSNVKLTALLSQVDIVQNDIRDADREINESEKILSSLMKLANCQSLEVLEQVENTFRQKKEFQSSIFKIEEELLELGNGQSLKAIIQETDQINHDSIEVELEEIKRKLEEIEPIRSEIEQEHGVIKKEFEEKILGNNTASVLREQQKESLLAKLANLTDQYVQLKLASSLLKRGIEHYRNQNQDPILKRACMLFEKLTLQSFLGLIVDYDDKDQPVLMGMRANGEKVPIDGMSDGTTDQLYLSLRIASIEKYIDENEPIPFIVDDILVHFDDSRSKVTLEILLELSQKTQVIFFTHHNRLVEIMNEIAHEESYQLTKIGIQESVVI